MCQRAETIIYAISTNWTPSRGKGDKVLTKMAEETGGQVFFPPSVEEMSNSFHDIEEELRSQYALTYTPADFKDDGSFRTIYLYCNDRRYQVRAEGLLRAPAVRAYSDSGNTEPAICAGSFLYIFRKRLTVRPASGQFFDLLFRFGPFPDSLPAFLT